MSRTKKDKWTAAERLNLESNATVRIIKRILFGDDCKEHPAEMEIWKPSHSVSLYIHSGKYSSFDVDEIKVLRRICDETYEFDPEEGTTNLEVTMEACHDHAHCMRIELEITYNKKDWNRIRKETKKLEE